MLERDGIKREVLIRGPFSSDTPSTLYLKPKRNPTVYYFVTLNSYRRSQLVKKEKLKALGNILTNTKYKIDNGDDAADESSIGKEPG